MQKKVAVITGASSGIGKQITLRLANESMELFLLGRNIMALEEVAKSARKTSPMVTCCKVDLSVNSDLKSTIDYLTKEIDYIDVLVHSAGIISIGHLENSPVEDFDRQYRINVRAPFILTQALTPMLKKRKGQVVFINSSAGLTSGANFSQYSATKFALKAIADSFRQEINPFGVRVLSIYPGRTASPMQVDIFKKEGRTYSPNLLLQPSDIAEITLSSLKLPRTAEVTDINIRPQVKS
ncbi:SDR family NAD(P)-dependent oxidoreductase [uncultured Draconibacterium sp.]|uniref:SDR family NAD(P)-dependent oxidoreductase n=1 Tax=uncultured Draconibacterium sp. TaxID=1573823 RepID=UPI0029C9B0CD|nr:SDR family NAD(P)-dependent oxidoreductase [uncultured Draconibacterium sp.]